MNTTDNGVRYLIHKIGAPVVQADNGRIVPSGRWWHDTKQGCGSWGLSDEATIYKTNKSSLPPDGEWVEIYTEVTE